MSPRLSARHAPLAVSLALVLLGGVLPGSPGVVNAAKPSTSSDPPRPMVASTTSTALAVSAGNIYTCAIRADRTLACWGYEEYGEATPPDGEFSAVSAGSTITCAVTAAGALDCWGQDIDGTTSPPDGTFTAVSTGESFACAIDSTGHLACWGNNDHFQSTPPAGVVKTLEAGSSHACAVMADDTLACWGDNEDGRAVPPPGAFLAVGAGDQHSCAIRANGTLACWGYNGENRSIPPLGTYVAVSVGYAHACAIAADGTIDCWGDDSSSQATPPPGMFKAVSSGYDHTCAIAADDTVTCWGDDSGGQVTPRPTAAMDDLARWSTTAALDVRWSARAALASVTSYDVQYRRAAWNGNLGSPTAWQTLTPAMGETLAASPGSTYCLSARAHDADGAVSDWTPETCTVVPLDDVSLARAGTWTAGSGSDYFRSTFVRSSTAGASLTRTGVSDYWVALLASTCPGCGSVGVYLGTSTKPVRVISLYSPTPVASRLIPILDAEANDEELYAGTITLKVAAGGKPVTIDGLLATRYDTSPAWADVADPPLPGAMTAAEPVKTVSAGASHTCAIREDGTIGCWGDNAYGKAMPPAGTFKAVAAGVQNACAIRTGDGSLACWGETGAAVTAPPDGAFTNVSVATWSACAVGDDGSLACWGGEYTYDDYEPPMGSYTAVTAVDVPDGYGDSYCAIREGDGRLDCWGEDFSDDPDEGGTQVPADRFTSIDGSCGIVVGGAVRCWGDDASGQATPPAGTFKAVTTGSLHACAITTGDAVVCWGDNEYFETAVPPGSFTAIDAGDHHTCAVSTTGTLACWGQDRSGQVTARPRATMRTLATWLTTRSVALAWSGSSLPAVSTYDIRFRRAAWNGGFGTVTPLLTGVATTAATPAGAPGSTYCYSARAHDAAGVVSAWSGETCTSIPLDERSLTRTGSWTAGTGSAYYNATYLRTTSSGATLTRTRIVATRLALVATTCPTCGSVKAYWNGTLIKTISLVSATTVNRKVIAIKTWTSARAGTLKLKVSSSGKRVLIDGLLVRRI